MLTLRRHAGRNNGIKKVERQTADEKNVFAINKFRKGLTPQT